MVRIVLALLCLFAGTSAFAQGSADDYPSRTVRIIVPFAAGGPTDAYARVLAEKLQTKFGQPFVVENKPGATGAVGTSFVATAPPDGYTLLFPSNSSQVVGPLLQGSKRAFDPFKDFRPLSMLLYYPMYLVVGTGVPAKTVQEFVALAKAQPDKMNFGSPGTGSGGHLRQLPLARRPYIPLYRRMRRSPRLVGTVALLILALVVCAVLAYQAWDAARSQQRTADSALHDYAKIADWQLTQQAKNALLDAGRHVAHRARRRASIPTRSREPSIRPSKSRTSRAT